MDYSFTGDILGVSILCTMFTFIWRNSPTRARAFPFVRFLDHTQWHTAVGRTSLDKGSARCRDLSSWQITTLKRDTHPCSWQDSNPQSQQARGCRPSPYTARPLGSAVCDRGHPCPPKIWPVHDLFDVPKENLFLYDKNNIRINAVTQCIDIQILQKINALIISILKRVKYLNIYI
jgi:hypothetical protein